MTGEKKDYNNNIKDEIYPLERGDEKKGREEEICLICFDPCFK